MTHPLREAYAVAFEEQAAIIADASERARAQFPGAEHGITVMAQMAGQFHDLADSLRGPEPVEVPHPDDPGKSVRIYADGTTVVLP
jgi:hypothetical protein